MVEGRNCNREVAGSNFGRGSELTVGQWVMGHGSNGSTDLGGSCGSRVSDPLTHFTLYSSGIPCDFLVHRKPATAIETVILTGQRRADNFGNPQISLGRPKFC